MVEGGVMKKIAVTVIGADKIGIVAGIVTELADMNINILDISQTILDGIFNMTLICDMEKSNEELKVVQERIENLGKKMGVDARAQLTDIFYSMHRI